MKIKLIAYYSIVLGISVIGLWIMILKIGSVTEGRTEMAFHLLSEFLMAVLCILSGFKLLMNHRRSKGVNILASTQQLMPVLYILALKCNFIIDLIV